MRQIWREAADLLETSVAAGSSDSSEIALLIDRQNGLRIVDAAGWSLEALQREYGSETAYSVKRKNGAVAVEARTGTSSCTITQSATSQVAPPFPYGGIAHHLICPPQPLLA